MPSDGPGVLAEAGRAFLRRPLALFAAAALALVPAHLLASAIAYVSAQRAADTETAPTRAENVVAQQRKVADRPAASASPDAMAAERRDLLRQAARPDPWSSPPRLRFGFGLGQALAFAVLFAGLLLAEAALLPLAFGQAGASGAWAAVGSRSRAIFAAVAAGAALVAVGVLCLLLPGLALAVAFLFAAPLALAEPLGGFRALQRSASLLRRVWPEEIALVLAAAGIDVAVHALLWRALPPRGPIAAALLDASIGAVLLPFPLLVSALLYLRARSAADGAPLEEIRQYMRRISAPG
jgi:hypothetical protein